MTDYPRDLRGYGANPPAAGWPVGSYTATAKMIRQGIELNRKTIEITIKD